MLTRRRVLCLAVLAALVVSTAACSDDGGSGSTVSDTGTTTDPAGTGDAGDPLEILVTNDDGVGAEGIDVLVEALRELPDVNVTVYAPAENQSGTGDTTSPGPVPTSEAETSSGYPAVAVQGTPADSVHAAFDAGVEPDVVVSGVNEGQNLGPIADELSGTVGAARTAVERGVPALAVSQGLGEPPSYEAGVAEAVDWLTEHRGELSDAQIEFASINVPTCETGSVRGLVEVPLAAAIEGVDIFAVDCESRLRNPADDVEAFVNGYATLTDLAVE